MKKGKCQPEPKNGYKEWRRCVEVGGGGGGILKGRKHLGESSPFSWSPSGLWRGYWILRDTFLTFSSLGTQKLAQQTVQ